MNGACSHFEALLARRQLGARFTLDGIRALCTALDNPQKDLRFVHIAGTNGKGSVAAMSAAILQESGLRTGLYTSPHLVRYHERFRLDDVEISDKELDRHLVRVMSLAESATYFEISTALALDWFRARGAEIVVWETGMGGRFDATSVVTPEVCVITHIGLDHTQYLGNTLARVAAEKAGIFKPGVPVITPEQDPSVLDVLRAECQRLGSPLTVIDGADLGEFEPPLAGAHQRWNTALAVAAVRAVRPAIGTAILRDGLRRTRWPVRCQLVERGAGKPPVLLDGAHNPLGAEALAAEIRRRWPRGEVTLIFGALGDKDCTEMGRILSGTVAHVRLCPVPNERTASVGEIARFFPGARCTESLEAALAEADREGRPIVVAGSLFLAGEALRWLTGGTSSPHPNESLRPSS